MLKNKFLYAPLGLLGAVMLGSLLLASCQKEQLGNRIEIQAEGFNGGNNGAKMYVTEGVRSYWQTGDKIMLSNIGIKAVTVEGSSAYIDEVSPAPDWALFPADIFAGTTTGRITVDMPHVYQFSELRSSPYGQILNAPMIALGVDNRTMQFKHLTGALNIVITNGGGSTLYIDRIKVKAIKCNEGTNYKLSGDFTYNIGSVSDIAATNTTTTVGDDQEVVLAFDTWEYSLFGGATRTFQIPVPMVGTNANPASFVVVVESHDAVGAKYTYTQMQTADASRPLGRAEAGYVPMTITDAPVSSAFINNVVSALFPVDEYGRYLIHTPTDFRLMVKAINQPMRYVDLQYNDANYVIDTAVIDMSGITIPAIEQFVGYITTKDDIKVTLRNLTVESFVDGSKEYFGLFYKPFGLPAHPLVSNINFENMTLKRCSSGNKTSCVVGAVVSMYQDNRTDYRLYLYDCDIPANNLNGLRIDFGELAPTNLIFGGLVGRADNEVLLHNCDVKLAGFANMTMATSDAIGAFIGGAVGQSNSSLYISSVHVTMSPAYSSTWELHDIAEPKFGGIVGRINDEDDFHANSEEPSSVSGSVNIYYHGTLHAGKIDGGTPSYSNAYVTTTNFTINSFEE